MKIKDLLAQRNNWAQGFAAYDSESRPVGPNHSTAVAWDLTGAIYMCYKDTEVTRVFQLIRERLRTIGHFPNLSVFNDNRTHEEVLALVTELDV